MSESIFDTDRIDYCPECDQETRQVPEQDSREKYINWTCTECRLVIDQEKQEELRFGE